MHFDFFLNLFIFGCVVSSLLCGLSLVAASGGYSSLWCMGFSSRWLLLLQSTGSRHAGFLCSAGSVVMAHGLSCSAACGIFLDWGSNLCPLHWQADSYPLHHQGSPILIFDGRYSLAVQRVSANSRYHPQCMRAFISSPLPNTRYFTHIYKFLSVLRESK